MQNVLRYMTTKPIGNRIAPVAAEIETIIPTGFAHGYRLSTEQQGASELHG